MSELTLTARFDGDGRDFLDFDLSDGKTLRIFFRYPTDVERASALAASGLDADELKEDFKMSDIPKLNAAYIVAARRCAESYEMREDDRVDSSGVFPVERDPFGGFLMTESQASKLAGILPKIGEKILSSARLSESEKKQ